MRFVLHEVIAPTLVGKHQSYQESKHDEELRRQSQKTGWQVERRVNANRRASWLLQAVTHAIPPPPLTAGWPQEEEQDQRELRRTQRVRATTQRFSPRPEDFHASSRCGCHVSRPAPVVLARSNHKLNDKL